LYERCAARANRLGRISIAGPQSTTATGLLRRAVACALARGVDTAGPCHLLNHNLGGPGDDMRNLTPFAKSTNSQHHSYVEKAAKEIKARGNILHYTVSVDYSKSPPSAWFGGKIAAAYLAKFAAGIKCVLQEYDGKTRDPIGKEVTTTVSNAITGQG
jgi:hypothetical protein